MGYRVRRRSNNGTLFPKRQQRRLTEWPSERPVAEVSTGLAQKVKVGLRWAASGDYFATGDRAYQIEGIIRAAEELLKKSWRLRR